MRASNTYCVASAARWGVKPVDYLNAVLELIDEGIIVVDSRGFIRVYNKLAREIFGIDHEEGLGHREGRINDGDIVCIADNMLGADDGGMLPEDLRLIGVDPAGVKPGDAIVAIGIKGAPEGTGVMKAGSGQGTRNELWVKTCLRGLDLESRIDFGLRRLRITVNGQHLDYVYKWAAGHLVVVDGNSGEIKFYQTRGYTARREELKRLLLGGPFKGKGKYGRALAVLGRHISELHPDSPIIDELLQVATGATGAIRGRETLINGIPVRCSMEPLVEGNDTLGALLKVVDVSELKALYLEKKNLENRLKLEQVQREAFGQIVGTSYKIKAVLEMARRAAETNSTVLLIGESGTGKGLFAEAIHRAGPRREGPFVYINCACIPETLLESELFGHEKGAFTGAVSQKQGKFEVANGGTIFLDEVGELPLSLQAKLLHVLQNRTFTRVGGTRPIQVDIRIIAASNSDLREAVSKGRFREDLFYRLNVICIVLPPLRERKEDIYPLVGYLMPKVCQKAGKEIKQVSDEVMKLFLDYHWPGNVRELENVLERAVVMCDGDLILPEHLPDYLLQATRSGPCSRELVTLNGVGPLKQILAEVEVKAIRRALEVCGGSRKKAMDLLGLGKTNFYKKLKQARSSHL